MSAISEIVAALQAVGFTVTMSGTRAGQGRTVTIDGYPRPLRLYAWQVTDNGQATGTVRPADERRIQAIGSRTQSIEATADPETVVLGWCDEFGSEPLIVAFNPYSVAQRVGGKIARKIATGNDNARASDSQQFRQALLDQAAAAGLAEGPNQHGEYVVAMKPAYFLEYLTNYKPRVHSQGNVAAGLVAAGPSMEDLISEAEGEEAAPVDGFETAGLQPFDPGSIADGRERVAREIAIRRGQSAFRRHLINAYGCCVMSGSTVIPTLEAAHIVPYQGPGTNHPSNGLLLRADLHTLFDMGLLAVDHVTFQILVHPNLNGTEYEALRGQVLQVGQAGAYPSRDALLIHRQFTQL
jgi:hypothetical protein